MSNELFTETLLDYINKTTARQWSAIDATRHHHFSTPSLEMALHEIEDQLGRVTPKPYPHTTHIAALGDWIGDITLEQLQQRMNTLVTRYAALPVTDPSWVYVKRVVGSSNDITFLGVYLYGLGIADGLYDEKSSSA